MILLVAVEENITSDLCPNKKTGLWKYFDFITAKLRSTVFRGAIIQS